MGSDRSRRSRSGPDKGGPPPGWAVTRHDTAADRGWDEFVALHQAGHYLQSSLWARLQALAGWEAVRLRVERDSRMVGGAQVLMRRVGGSMRLGAVVRGPVLAEESPEAIDAVLWGLDQLVRDRRLAALVVQPPVRSPPLQRSMRDRRYRPSPVGIGLDATTEIDLQRSEEEWLRAMAKGHRRSLRRALDAGWTVRDGTAADLDRFYDLHVASSRRHRFRPHNNQYFHHLWSIFGPEGNARLMLCEREDRLVAGQIVITFGGRAVAKYGGWTGAFGKLGPNHLMDWTAMRTLKAAGFRKYELEGVGRQEARLVRQGRRSEIPPGTATYKLDFGGDIVVFPSRQVLARNRLLGWALCDVLPALDRRIDVRDLRDRLRTRRRETGRR